MSVLGRSPSRVIHPFVAGQTHRLVIRSSHRIGAALGIGPHELWRRVHQRPLTRWLTPPTDETGRTTSIADQARVVDAVITWFPNGSTLRGYRVLHRLRPRWLRHASRRQAMTAIGGMPPGIFSGIPSRLDTSGDAGFSSVAVASGWRATQRITIGAPSLPMPVAVTASYGTQPASAHAALHDRILPEVQFDGD